MCDKNIPVSVLSLRELVLVFVLVLLILFTPFNRRLGSEPWLFKCIQLLLKDILLSNEGKAVININ